MPFDDSTIDRFYAAADHGALGLYWLIKKRPFYYLEDARGVYSKWEGLARIIAIKDPGMHAISMQYKAYGKSELIKRKYIAFESQSAHYNANDCFDFNVDKFLDELNTEFLDKIFTIFNVKKYHLNNNRRNTLVLTQRFATYKWASEEDIIFMYALLCDIFAKDSNIFLKPHPGDTSNYSATFSDMVIIDKETPSELTRFIIDKNFETALCTYSTSIDSLRSHIDNIYNIDDSILAYKSVIFKFYFLFELAKKISYNVHMKECSLSLWFDALYNLNSDNYIVYNGDKKCSHPILISDEKFFGANRAVQIIVTVGNNQTPLVIDKLYISVNDTALIKAMLTLKPGVTFPLSKVTLIYNFSVLP